LNTDRHLAQRLHGVARNLIAGFSTFTPVQRQTIPLILDRKSVFLIAPTASGKTEAALSPILELRSRERWRGRPSILYVVPTRALVNDIHRRLNPLLNEFLVVGRRTGEYREPNSDILITTPESFDSMLARGRQGGGTHILNDVRAIVLDELHLLVESARGTQLHVLLSRLDFVAKEPVLRVALSATVSNNESLAKQFLGPDAQVVSCGGGRALRVDRLRGDGPLPPRPEGGIDPLAAEIRRQGRGPRNPDIPRRLLEIRGDGKRRLKALVFVASRARCDTLSSEILRYFTGRCPIPVVAHHGSLSQQHREQAEAILTTSPESVAVATATLELGIDIGDVNLVVLDGPPGSVSSLLQRIGRANRREKAIHLLPYARNDVDAIIFASMIRAAEAGVLDDGKATAHYSVVIQQLASLFFQSSRARLSRKNLVRIFGPTFGEDVPFVLQQIADGGWLNVFAGEIYGPGEELRELMDNPLALHANIGNGMKGIPLIDAVTGDPIAWVIPPRPGSTVVLAGSSYEVARTTDAYELHNEIPGGRGKRLMYNPRSAPVSRSALRHLCAGLGLKENAVVRVDNKWIHFGGALYAKLLDLAGVDSHALSSDDDPRHALSADIDVIIDRNWEQLERFCGFGPYHDDLPRSIRKVAVKASIPMDDFSLWLERMEECPVDQEQKNILIVG